MIEEGTRIGAYEVLRPLGAGGMGQVYLARDTRLEREVALKVLSPALVRDPDHLARFRREALIVASLNHPNIATIFGFEEPADGPTILVLELVEGESLGARLRRGTPPVEESLQICVQIAQALEAAHERGVVHRDVKPANVMLGARGVVKVLDFGLATRYRGLAGIAAKPDAMVSAPTPAAAPPASEPPSMPTIVPRGVPLAAQHTRITPPAPPSAPPPTPPAAAEDAPTIAGGEVSHDAPTIAAPPSGGASDDTIAASASPPRSAAVSESGMVVGTPGYMAPEQVVAGAQDERTDVFAFGCVLYECLAGRTAFSGRDLYATMAAVLTDVPDFTAIPERTPARVRTLLERCLEKNLELRLPDIRTARTELEEALGIRRAAALREGEAVATPNNLPALGTSFVGRETALAECRRLFETTRWLTLAGIGGSGKTRLALSLAGSSLETFHDGVWFADLAALTEPERVAQVIAATLGVREQPGVALADSVVEHLRPLHVLLVLDNCEDVLSGARAFASAVLAGCPQTRVIATSREPLGGTGETVFSVPTLAVPRESDLRDPAAIAACEAVRLFVERARAAQPGFALDRETAPVVAEICRALDGIPLAIELAAARVKVLGVAQIHSRLDDRFKLLTKGGSGTLQRSMTLLATIQWSWDHLATLEQDLLRRLAVFVGGWTLERGTSVAGDGLDEFEVLDLMTRLVDRSLVVVTRHVDGSAHYRMLETVWRFALTQLQESGEADEIRSRHRELYLKLAEDSERQLTGPKQSEWIADLDRERENLLAALASCASVPEGGAIAMRLASAVCRGWSARGHYALGRRALEEALALGAEDRTPVRATTLVRAGAFALYQGDVAAARPRIEEGLAIYRALGDRKGIARALSGLGVVAMYASDYAAARAIGEESLEIYRSLSERRGEAQAVYNLGYVAWCLHDFAESKRLYEEALVLLERVGDEESIALSLGGLGLVLSRLGDAEGARRRFRECLDRVLKLGARRAGVYAIEVVAEFANSGGRPQTAARLLGAAATIRRAIGSPTLPIEHKELEALSGRIRDALGEQEFSLAIQAGSLWSFEEALEQVTRALESSAS